MRKKIAEVVEQKIDQKHSSNLRGTCVYVIYIEVARQYVNSLVRAIVLIYLVRFDSGLSVNFVFHSNSSHKLYSFVAVASRCLWTSIWVVAVKKFAFECDFFRVDFWVFVFATIWIFLFASKQMDRKNTMFFPNGISSL